jgi:hypothetical protein
VAVQISGFAPFSVVCTPAVDLACSGGLAATMAVPRTSKMFSWIAPRAGFLVSLHYFGRNHRPQDVPAAGRLRDSFQWSDS